MELFDSDPNSLDDFYSQDKDLLYICSDELPGYYDFGSTNSKLIHLKDIEQIFGGVILGLTLLLLIWEIILTAHTCKIGEFTTIRPGLYIFFKIMRIIMIIISIITIISYAVISALLVICNTQYHKFCLNVPLSNSFNSKIIFEVVLEITGCILLIILVVVFFIEIVRFVAVGSDDEPGPKANFLSNGKSIQRNQEVIITSDNNIELVQQEINHMQVESKVKN